MDKNKTTGKPAKNKLSFYFIIIAIIAAGIIIYFIATEIHKHYQKQNIIADMIFIPGGEIEIGGNPECPWEGDRRKVFVEPFYIDPYEVTNAEYKRFVDDGGYLKQDYWSAGWEFSARFVDKTKQPGPAFWQNGAYPPGERDYPVTGICFYEAAAYAKWAGKRLPTDLEWMVAAGWDPEQKKMRKYPWGDEFDASKCNSQESNKNKTMPVGSYESGKSYYGCYDMAGNVLEWTSTTVNDQPMVTRGKNSIDMLILKGGAYFTGAKFVRVECIALSDPVQKNIWPIIGNNALVRQHDFYGFRCVYRPKDN